MRPGRAALRVADGLSLAAAPTFALMAVLSGLAGPGPADMLCTPMGVPLGGMAPMYLLMSAFHAGAWLRWIAAVRPRQDVAPGVEPGTGRSMPMPKIDVAAIRKIKGVGYPPPFDAPCAERVRQRLGQAGGLTDFGVNLMRLPPGGWSSQRHWHSHEDEFVYVLSGELVLVEDHRETLLRAGDCAAFPKGTGDGHHMINRAQAVAVYLEVGSRQSDDVTTCSDIDLKSANADGRFVHKDGAPYGET